MHTDTEFLHGFAVGNQMTSALIVRFWDRRSSFEHLPEAIGRMSTLKGLEFEPCTSERFKQGVRESFRAFLKGLNDPAIDWFIE